MLSMMSCGRFERRSFGPVRAVVGPRRLQLELAFGVDQVRWYLPSSHLCYVRAPATHKFRGSKHGIQSNSRRHRMERTNMPCD